MTLKSHLVQRLNGNGTSEKGMVMLLMEHDPLPNMPGMATGEMVKVDGDGNVSRSGRFFLVPASDSYQRKRSS